MHHYRVQGMISMGSTHEFTKYNINSSTNIDPLIRTKRWLREGMLKKNPLQ